LPLFVLISVELSSELWYYCAEKEIADLHIKRRAE
jgi:hypothetical protein